MGLPVWEAVDAKRAELGVPKSAVAKRLGVSADTVGKRLAGKREFKVSELVELARWWGVSLDSLAGIGGE